MWILRESQFIKNIPKNRSGDETSDGQNCLSLFQIQLICCTETLQKITANRHKKVSAWNHNSLLKRKTYGSVSPGRELSLKAYHFRFFPPWVTKCWFVKHIFWNYNQIQILITPSLFMRSKQGRSETQIPVLVRLTHMYIVTLSLHWQLSCKLTDKPWTWSFKLFACVL